MSIPLGAQLDFASLGSMQVAISHCPVMGEVHCEYQSGLLPWHPWPGHPPQFAQLKPLDPPDSEELWANMMAFTYSMSNYSAPTPLRSDQECVVSLFMSRIDVSTHDEAFLIIEPFDVIQPMLVHLFSHLDHSVFIHHVLFNFSWWTRQSNPVMCPWTIHTKPTIITWCHFSNGVSTHPQNGVKLEIEDFKVKQFWTILKNHKFMNNFPEVSLTVVRQALILLKISD